MTTNLTLDRIQGFFDADGSFEAKVYLGKQKLVSFYVNMIFSQASQDFLADILDRLKAVNSKGINPKKITDSLILTESGGAFKAYSISIAFYSIAGQLLLESWQINPPKVPTKYLDYRISLILAEVSENLQNTALSVVKKYLPTENIKNEKIAAGALLYLRNYMRGKNSRQSTYISIETYFEKLNFSQTEIDQSMNLGKQLFLPIQKDCECLSSNILSSDYLIGYHLGDGSFWIQLVFEGKGFKAKFNWSLTESKENKKHLELIKTKLESEGVKSLSITDYKTYSRLRISNQSDCQRLLALFDKSGSNNLPQVRQNQYNAFKRGLALYTSANFREDLSLMEEFAKIVWNINPGTISKRKSSLEEDLSKVKTYFDTKNKK
jgi:hypothetical protein